MMLAANAEQLADACRSDLMHEHSFVFVVVHRGTLILAGQCLTFQGGSVVSAPDAGINNPTWQLLTTTTLCCELTALCAGTYIRS